jgi:hypothetical protein
MVSAYTNCMRSFSGERGEGPAVVSRDRNTRAVGQVRVNRQRGERYQRSSAEK